MTVTPLQAGCTGPVKGLFIPKSYSLGISAVLIDVAILGIEQARAVCIPYKAMGTLLRQSQWQPTIERLNTHSWLCGPKNNTTAIVK